MLLVLKTRGEITDVDRLIYLIKVHVGRPTWWNRPFRYPNVALNPFEGSETMVRLCIMLDNLVAKCFNLFGMFGNVWERIERIAEEN